MKRYLGEVIFEVCEGLENGIDDFKEASIRSTESVSLRYMGGDQMLAGLFTSMYGNTFWNLLQGCFEFHQNEVLPGLQRQAAGGSSHSEVDSIIAEIRGIEVSPQQANSGQSEAYKKGSLGKSS